MSGLPFNLSRNVKASVAVAGQFANNDILLMVVYVEIGTGGSAMEREGSGDPSYKTMFVSFSSIVYNDFSLFVL